MIQRHWRGLAKRGEANNYIRHLETETFPLISAISGFVKASILRRSTGDGVEFLIVTIWESMDAIRKFAGDDPEKAVVPGVVKSMMLTYEQRVKHYEVVSERDHY
ncbi:MAG: antibiotic biosynthesis monooxygenase [Chitinophagaceae bacterium]|nr:antibiotic biosynthesis monooxygenase [Chitinophagaceae bacterium]